MVFAVALGKFRFWVTFLRTFKRLFWCVLSCVLRNNKRAVLLLQLPVTLKVTHKRAFSLVTNLGNQNFLLTNLLTMPQ